MKRTPNPTRANQAARTQRVVRRKLTEKDVRMLTDVRDRLRAKLRELGIEPAGAPDPAPVGTPAPVGCRSHGVVPWTACAVCSRPAT